MADGWMERDGNEEGDAPWSEPWADAEGWNGARGRTTKGSGRRPMGVQGGRWDQAAAYSLDSDYDGVWGDMDASERGWSSLEDAWPEDEGYTPYEEEYTPSSQSNGRRRGRQGAAVRYYGWTQRLKDQTAEAEGYYPGQVQNRQLTVANGKGKGKARQFLPPCTDEDEDDDWYTDPEDEGEEIELNEYGFSMKLIENRIVPRHSPNPGIANDLHMPQRPDGKGWRDDSVKKIK